MSKKTKDEILDALYNDLLENKSASSWDWPADLRFAKIIEDKEAVEIIETALSSYGGGTTSHRWAAIHLTGIPKKRLRYLRLLVKDKRARSYWVGLGEGSVNELGVNRTREYEAI